MRQTRVSRSSRDFGGNDAGVAAIEFALILPVIFALLLATTDVIRYFNADRRLQNAARSAAQIAAGGVTKQTFTSRSPGGPLTEVSGDITDWELSHRAVDVAPLMMPELKTTGGDPWRGTLQWDGAVVTFTAASGGFTGKVKYAWGKYGCGTVPKGASLSATAPVTVPDGMYGPNDVVVVRLAYDFTPRFTSGIVPSTKLVHMAVMNSEQSSKINLRPTGDSTVKACP